MFTRRFVSIYFSSKEVRVVQLTGNGKNVKTFLAVKIPDGVLSQRNVKDEAALGELLKKVWQKLKTKEKSVGLVIPEFSTLTKVMEVPKVEKKELDEAVRWQAQEFLPWEEEDTILDWKLIGEDDKNYHVLFVAVRQKVLHGYVNALSLAGLFPIVVETPSLSLVRLSKSGDVPKFIFYGGKNSSIFIVAKGEKIIGNSVIYTNEEAELKSTAERMAQHYKDVGVESVEVDGPSASQAVVAHLGKIFGKEVSHLTTAVGGISKEDIGQFLIPISLQMKDPAEPADMNTINLLPLNLVKKYETKKLQLQVWSLSLVVSYVVWLTFFATLAAYLFLGQQATLLRAGSNGLNPASGNIDTITQIQNVNNLVDKVTLISGATVYPQEILNPIYEMRPEDVTIGRYKLNLDTGEIQLYGIADNRASLILYKQKLEEIEEFSIIDIPIAALEVENDLEYTMSFTYLPISATRRSN